MGFWGLLGRSVFTFLLAVLIGSPSVFAHVHEISQEFDQVLLEIGIESQEKRLAIFRELEKNMRVSTVRRQVEWMTSIGVTEPAKVIVRCPRILSVSHTDDFNEKIQWFKEQGVINMGQLITKAPQIFKRSLELSVKFSRV